MSLRALALGGVLVCALPLAADVRVWQGVLNLPTYEEGPPDPNPPFDQYGGNRFNYPYTLRNNLTDRRADHAWRAVFLENEYLRCSVLPDLGGHLYTCTDKRNGQSMFYANPSIKKANIGYRGAWSAFGIEFNFPVSHNWVSQSPVDFSFGSHPDGSASVTVGNIDRVYGMEWSVELQLRPGSTVLEQHVTLNNRSDVRHRFYWWNNAGVEVWDDSQICYPMRFAASHGFANVQPWPIDSTGVDLSVIRNQTRGNVSLFVHGSREPFMGVWHPRTNSGVVHYADYGDLPGKKIWSWGVDADGLDWRRALSDNNSAYVEVQAGLFRNQETYAFLQPRQTIRFTEYWMPVRDLGGIARANLNGVLNLSRRDGKLKVAFNANRNLPGAKAHIMAGPATAVEGVDLSPDKTWTREIPITDGAQRFTFELADASGTVLMRQTEGEYDWTPASEIQVGPQTAHRFPPATSRTADDWLEIGKDDELNGRVLIALDTYRDGLEKFPASFELAKAAGRLAAALQRYREAVDWLAAVQKRDTPDPEIAYYLGLAYEGLGETRKAVEQYETASRLPDLRAAAHLRLGEWYARQGDRATAEHHLEEARKNAPDDPRTVLELGILRGDEPHVNSEHVPADPDRILELAATYMRLGRYERALAVLSADYAPVSPDRSEPGVPPPARNPLLAYYRAWCLQKLNRPADWMAASKLPVDYVFPNRPESLEMLQAALRVNPQDATARYLLGTLLFSRGLTDPALAEWEQARTVNPRLPVLHASMGMALLRIKRDPQRALPVFEQGLAADPSNLANYTGVDQAMSALHRPARDIAAALAKYPDLAHMPSALVYELALTRAEAGEFDAAESLFHNRFFAREEGGVNVRQVWTEVRLLRALSEPCVAAVPAIRGLANAVPDLDFTRDGMEPFRNAARTRYLSGLVESRCGNRVETEQQFRAAAAQLRDPVWARAAARKLPGFDDAQWRARLQSGRGTANPSSQSLYQTGLADLVLGRKNEAEAAFRQALLLPDSALAWHLVRLSRSGIPE